MRYGFMMAAAAFVLVFAAEPLPAHHSVASMYDISKVVAIQGVVTEIRWENPHAHYFLDVKDAAGSTVNWDVELPPPNVLVRQGWTKNAVKQGDQITVDVWLAKDGKPFADARSITLADGRTVSCPSGWL